MQFLVCTRPSKLFSNGATKETTGEIFEKLKLAVEYNASAPPTKGEATTIQKRLPNLSNDLSKNHRQSGILSYKSLDNAEKTLNQQLQTDWISTETQRDSKTFCMVLTLVLLPKMVIIVSGYGKLDIDKVLKKKIISSNHFSSVRASYEAQNVQFSITHLSNFFFTKKFNEQ